MIRLKIVLRNVIGKPLRTAIIILSLAAAAFTALFCISGINTAQNGLRDYFRANFGEADIMIYSYSSTVKVESSAFPQNTRILEQTIAGITMTTPNPDYLNYVKKVNIGIVGMDTQSAYEMKLLERPFSTDGGVTVTEAVAKQFDKKVGDELSIKGQGGREFKLKILEIASPAKFLQTHPVCILTTREMANAIAGNDKDSVSTYLADVPDNQISDTIASMSAQNPDLLIFGTTSTDSDDSLNSALSVYYLIFAVVFLMVCFIVVSMSKHIVNERMSLIGTLRSIGGSIRSTGFLLLAESAFYGLCGGILGTTAFMPFRSNTDLGYFSAAVDIEMEISDGITPLSVCLVILSVILLQCIFSAAAIFRASQKPVRDIIFGTKETAYLPSKLFTTVGIILLILGAVSYMTSEDFTMIVLAALCSAIGAVMLFPMIVKIVSNVLADVFHKSNMPVAKLAVKEIASKKSSISSFQLILSAMSLTIAMVVLSNSMIKLFSTPIYDCNIMVTPASQEGERYDFIIKNIDGVKDIEKLYYTNLSYETKAEWNGEKRDLTVFGYDSSGFRYFSGISELPNKVAENEICVDKTLASKLSLTIGDEVTLGLNTEKYHPRELKLKISSLCDASVFNSRGNTVLLNMDTYKAIYFDQPQTVLIVTEPAKMGNVLKTMRSTMADDDSSIILTEEYTATLNENLNSVLSVLYAIITLGFALSLLGTFSNMLMGFEQSRRKYAVYYSSAMSREQLRKLITLETAFTAGLSSIASVIFGLYFLHIISKALTLLDMSVPVKDPVLFAVITGVVSFIILMATILKPVRLLSKMNIAEEIKMSAD